MFDAIVDSSQSMPRIVSMNSPEATTPSAVMSVSPYVSYRLQFFPCAPER